MGKKKEEFEEYEVQVLYGSINVRKDPFVEDGNIIRVLPIKTIVKVIGEYRGWLQIEPVGWIMAKYCEPVF